MAANNIRNSGIQSEELPHNSRGPTMLTVIWFSAILSATVLSLRLYCKKKTYRGLWWDDVFALASWASMAVYVCLTTYCVVQLDYGSRDWDIPPQNFPIIMKMAAARHPFSLLSIMWSKTSFGVTLLRIATGWLKRAVWVLIISTNIFLGFSIIIFYIQCTPIRGAVMQDKCLDRGAVMKYHVFSGVFFPWKILWGLQMLAKEKLGIAVAMSMGVFAAATSIIKTCQLYQLTPGRLYDSIPIMYWGPIETATTIIAASIPVLRVLIRDACTSPQQHYRSEEGEDSEIRAQRQGAVICVGRRISDDGSETSFRRCMPYIDITAVSADQKDGILLQEAESVRSGHDVELSDPYIAASLTECAL
ncbi:hypothetical protein BKA66DRAFT_473217 [Pyrenochaeta sp. MPI-SDFR-AT-0127]|nr:hypothetical protein BKA66DRAFT_473217 [Pyrenochaeta sp. MPI-SDFR-AT-0127]